MGVFINESVERIIALSKSAGFKVVQLHGDEGQLEIVMLQQAGLQVIKAISVATESDVEDLTSTPDFYLFDTKKGAQVGGTGEKFDWQILESYPLAIPYFLAGGLDASNMEAAKSFKGLYALDFNSKLEITPGQKDLTKVNEILTNLW